MTQMDRSPPVSGSGVLFTILFRAKSTATSSALTFTQTDLVGYRRDADGRHGGERQCQHCCARRVPTWASYN